MSEKRPYFTRPMPLPPEPPYQVSASVYDRAYTLYHLYGANAMDEAFARAGEEPDFGKAMVWIGSGIAAARLIEEGPEAFVITRAGDEN